MPGTDTAFRCRINKPVIRRISRVWFENCSEILYRPTSGGYINAAHGCTEQQLLYTLYKYADHAHCFYSLINFGYDAFLARSSETGKKTLS